MYTSGQLLSVRFLSRGIFVQLLITNHLFPESKSVHYAASFVLYILYNIEYFVSVFILEIMTFKKQINTDREKAFKRVFLV